MQRTRVLPKNSDKLENMIRNHTDAETDATDREGSEDLYRNPRCIRILPSPRSLGQIRQRSLRGESCARCSPSTMQTEARESVRRKRKTKSQVQHCPSCHCPPEILRTSSVRFRDPENMEAVLQRYEKYLAEPYPMVKKSMKPQSPGTGLSHCRSLQNDTVARNGTASNHHHHHHHHSDKDHDQMLDALLNDLVCSGLANEQTQECCDKHHGTPIKSVYKKGGPREDRQVPREKEDFEADLDSESLSRYFRDCKNLKRQSSNTVLQRREQVQEQREKIQRKLIESVHQENDEKDKEEEWRQFERDRRELDELDHELRVFEKQKERQRDDEDRQWDNRQKSRTEDEERLRRKLASPPSKLPVPMCNNARPRSLETPGSGSPKEQVKSRCCRMEASTSYHSVSIADNKNNDNNNNDDDDDEDEEEFSNNHFEYAKEDDPSLDQELKDIPYCEPCCCPSAPNPDVNKLQEEATRTTVADTQPLKSKLPESQGSGGAIKKSGYGGGDLDLHASKSYIVDLIDRALSKELGTMPEERKGETRQGPTQQEICVEITRALQGDCFQSLINNFSNQQETPDYVRQLKVLRWEYLNHIQDELRKLQDLERFLDTCSPRQSLPVLQSQSSTTEQKKEQRATL